MAKEILSAQHARDELEKNEQLKAKIKKFILPSLISTIVYFVGFSLFWKMGSQTAGQPSLLTYIFGIVFVAGLIANIIMFIVAVAYGGKAMLKLMVSTIFLGFVLLVFPFNIMLGFMILVMTFYYGIQAPILIFALALIKIKRENKKYEKYLQYCPDNATGTTETPMQ